MAFLWIMKLYTGLIIKYSNPVNVNEFSEKYNKIILEKVSQVSSTNS